MVFPVAANGRIVAFSEILVYSFDPFSLSATYDFSEHLSRQLPVIETVRQYSLHVGDFSPAVTIPPLDNGDQQLRIVRLDGNQDHSSRNRSSTYSNARRCRLSRYINDKKRASGGRRTYSNALRCRLSRLAMIKNNASGHRRTYSNALRC